MRGNPWKCPAFPAALMSYCSASLEAGTRAAVLKTLAIVLLLGVAGCSGGGSGSVPITVSGRVFDVSGAPPVGVAGATVTLRDSSGASLSSAVSASDGSYSLPVPPSTRTYIATSKSGYVNCNSSIFTLSSNGTLDVILLTPAGAKETADAINGGVGGSSWNDAFYSQSSWFGIDFLTTSGNDAPGLRIVAAPGDATVAYNNGADLFSTTPPTKSSNNQPLVGGYSASSGIYTFATNFNQVVELPLKKGEFSFALYAPQARTLVWSAATSGTTNTLFGVTSSASAAVAVGSLGTILTSSDGISWMSTPSGVNAHLNGVATSGTQFVAVGDSGTIVTSSDLITWTPRTSGTPNRLRGVAWTGSQFVSVGDAGTILTSADGASWTVQTSGTASDLYGVAGNGTQNIAVGAGGTILSSPSGAAWTPRTSHGGDILHSVTWSGVQFLIAGDNSPNGYGKPVQTSFDGIGWTGQSTASANPMNGSAWSGAQFMIVGSSSLSQTSSDGISWMQNDPLDISVDGFSVGITLYGVSWFKKQFIAVGTLGAIVAF